MASIGDQLCRMVPFVRLSVGIERDILCQTGGRARSTGVGAGGADLVDLAPLMTNFTRWRTAISRVGSPSNAARSASRPCSIADAIRMTPYSTFLFILGALEAAMRIRIVGPLFLLVCVSSVPAFAAPCDQLAAVALKDATVTSARLVSAGEFVPPTTTENATNRNAFKNLPAFCRVAATLRPSSDSDIKVEVWLPATGWNGKF